MNSAGVGSTRQQAYRQKVEESSVLVGIQSALGQYPSGISIEKLGDTQESPDKETNIRRIRYTIEFFITQTYLSKKDIQHLFFYRKPLYTISIFLATSEERHSPFSHWIDEKYILYFVGSISVIFFVILSGLISFSILLCNIAIYFGEDKYPFIHEYLQIFREKLNKEIILDDFLQFLKDLIPKTGRYIINSKNKAPIAYTETINFLMGGNTLGRGVTVDDLLVTYYGREVKMGNMDTMHQHARMFGYRSTLLPFTKVFMSQDSLDRFEAIYESDESIRNIIRNRQPNQRIPIIVQASQNLLPTRAGVVRKEYSNIVSSGAQLFPKSISEAQHRRNFAKTQLEILPLLQGMNWENSDQQRILVDQNLILDILGLISTGDRSYGDDKVWNILPKINEQLGTQEVIVKKTNATSRTFRGGFVGSGVLSGEQFRTAKADNHVTIYISEFAYTDRDDLGIIYYPTIVIPSQFQSIIVYQAR